MVYATYPAIKRVHTEVPMEATMKQFSSTVSGQVSELGEFLMALHKNERGDNENLGRLLILALILIPLVILIVFFGQQIADAARTKWDELVGKPVAPNTN